MQLVKEIITPIFILLSIGCVGCLFILLNYKKRLGIVFIVLSMFFIGLLSFRPCSQFLLWGLEKQYPPLEDFTNIQDKQYIVILAGPDRDNKSVPYTSKINYRSAFRTLEAHRIYEKIPNAKIIISGSEISVKLLSQLLNSIGVDDNSILVDIAQTTWESAENMKHHTSNKPCILVTSAIHMPRAMSSFMSAGLYPTPAPADFLYGYYTRFKLPLNRPSQFYVPNIHSFWRSHLAIYEYFGNIWYRMKLITAKK